MANDLNRCDFIGRLGKDPETRFTQDGKAISNISIACGWKTKEKEGAEWVSIVFFGKLAEIVNQYLKKGSKIYVSGRYRTRKWQDSNGQDRYTTEVIANEMQMLDSRGDNQAKQEIEKPQQPTDYPKGEPAKMADFDDDIPF